MRTATLITTILAGVSLVSIANAQAFPWRTDYEKAKKESQTSGKPLMLYFTTEWCGWCKVMEKETFTDQKVIEQAKRYIPVVLDAEKEGVELAKKHKIDSYPIFVFVKPDDSVMGEVVGYRNASDFQVRVDQIFDGKSELARLNGILEKNPNDGAALCELAVFQIGEGEYQKAMANIDKAKKAEFKGQQLANALSELGNLMSLMGQYAKAIEYLEESLVLKDPNSTSVTFNRLILALMHIDDNERLRATAKRVIESPYTSPKQKEDSALGLRTGEYAKQLQTPEQVVDKLVEQLVGVPEGTRDLFYFTALFMSDARINIVASSQGRGMLFSSETKTYHKQFSIDKLEQKFTVQKKEIQQDGMMATARLEVTTDFIGSDKKHYVIQHVIHLSLMLYGPRWYISHFQIQALANQ